MSHLGLVAGDGKLGECVLHARAQLVDAGHSAVPGALQPLCRVPCLQHRACMRKVHVIKGAA